jgi:phage-related protein
MGRRAEFRTEIVEFAAGDEQRYRQWGGPGKSWRILLDRLDDAELAAIDEFVTEHAGTAATFTFTDPHDSMEHAECELGQEELWMDFYGWNQGRTEIVIRQRRS